MPNKLANRVKMSVSGTPGTGTITLGVNVTGFQTFAAAGISNGDTVPYVLEDGTSWEVGVGTYSSSGPSLARTSISASSNSGSAISATQYAYIMLSPLASDLQIGTAIQAWDGDLDAIAGLSGTSGFLKKTAANTWTLDASSYITTGSIGSSVQAYDGDLDAIAAISGTSGLLKKTAANTWSLDTTTYQNQIGSSGILKGAGAGSISAATAGTDYVAPGTATSFTAAQTFSGSSSSLASVLVNAAETTTVSATAATGTINYDITTQSVLYYTSNASANWTVNFRASSGTSLNTAMATGQSVTVAFLVTQGGTAYYNSVVQVDGSSVTPKWQGGTAPTAGNASSIDVYTYTIVKTGSAAFTVFASQTKFA